MRRARPVIFGTLAVIAACTHPLPDPDSAGAVLYRERCGTCHNLHDPHALTAAMWELQMGRMQQEMLRRGVTPLTEQEQLVVLSYLRAHSTDAGAGAVSQ